MNGSGNRHTDVSKVTCSNESVHRISFTDIHCHCLPQVDDGPSTLVESLVLCQALVEDGITAAIATPHQLGRFCEVNEANQIRQVVSMLNDSLRSSGISLAVYAGGDVRVDERICALLDADKILTLADGGKYILLELPHQVFLDIYPLIADLSSMGIRSIVSHPERHPVLSEPQRRTFAVPNGCDNLGIPLKWFDYPIHLQITAGSLLGQFGPQAQRAGWHFLRTGLASLVATDCHDPTDRKPCMKAAFDIISLQLGVLTAKRVCIDNPLKILKGQDIESPRTISTRMCGDEVFPNNF